jgi:hypothetical protein
MNNLEKGFTLYPEALELKQLGFDERCFAFYQVEYHENSPIMVDDDDEYLSTGFRTCKNSEIESHYTSCPTYSQAFRWFREKHNIHAWIINAEDNHNVFKPFFRGANIHDQHLVDFYKTYEEAELACLKKLIEIIKNK